MIQKDGAVTTAKLMELFDISIETVRRDLLAMEKANLLKRVHGGAVVEGEIKKLPPLDVRKTENVKLKQEVVKNATATKSAMRVFFIKSDNFYKFHLKYERAVRGNHLTCAICAVSHILGNEKTPF